MDKLIPSLPTPLQELKNEVIKNAGVQLYIKRDDLIHPTVSGNKWRKLKYNLMDARLGMLNTLLTFGGAYSNHLYATAAAGNAIGLQTIGVVRGEDFKERMTPTLRFCEEQNMILHFVSRQDYRLRNDPEYLNQLSRQFNFPYLIPEGGSSHLALKGIAEMTAEVDKELGFRPDYYAVAAGTGGTAAGILSSGNNVLAFSALKGGDFLKNDIMNLIHDNNVIGKLDLQTDYHFSGYGKWTPQLIDFILRFKNEFDIQLEQIYTAKMFYGLFDLISKNYFTPGTIIVAVHTGGLQGLTDEARQL
ncbi:1-aminocyclopropane-1-carboxylate deaminase/D-cysteine desulfhydrase [Dyadobacter psychrotolerans]|uniref:Pyridoxal-phosphate dependent enzyme n=1 Tax=Dyadobacter psychrotolerans TaxID=2541721 RepID=A0A4R5E077_9BACT|nr:pyridoxal-phosphate dependent enzyme [Dyadobacter psychrotolerans]TDE18384.1 pyridoxal-phosphate dependent enzyme [Dyadobacter psychrotolerans]